MKNRLPFVLAAFLTAGPALAQKPTTEQLQAEILKLRQHNEELAAKNKLLERRLAGQQRVKAPAKAPVAVRRRPAQDADNNKKKKLAAEAKNLAADVARIQQALKRARARATARVTLRTNPLVQGEYQQALADLQADLQKLRAIKDVDAAIKSVDALSQVLLRARAALWKQKQAKKNAPK